jgi:tetratricopeptide (TPR) repeat protein
MQETTGGYQENTHFTPALKEALWESLVNEPNDPDLLRLWLFRHQDAWGDAAAVQALAAVARTPNAWLARIWTTREMLAQGRLNEAMAIYESVLALVPNSELAMQEISGHLGEAGYYDEALHLLLQRYVPRQHGALTALNLLNCCLDAGDHRAGRQLLNRLLMENWPGFESVLMRFSPLFERDTFVSSLTN